MHVGIGGAVAGDHGRQAAGLQCPRTSFAVSILFETYVSKLASETSSFPWVFSVFCAVIKRSYVCTVDFAGLSGTSFARGGPGVRMKWMKRQSTRAGSRTFTCTPCRPILCLTNISRWVRTYCMCACCRIVLVILCFSCLVSYLTFVSL